MTETLTPAQIADLCDKQRAGPFTVESDARFAVDMLRQLALHFAIPPNVLADPALGTAPVMYATLKPLPAAYAWLATRPGLSRILIEGLALFGLTETPGPANTPMIMALAKEVGLEKSYPNDATAWCGLLMAAVAKRAGWEVVGGPLWARNWANFGRKVEETDAALGDVLVFSREGGGGHVGLYVGEDAGYFHVLGGNQSDAVTITRIAKGRLLAVRRPKWKTAEPAGVVKVHLKATGAISTNEA